MIDEPTKAPHVVQRLTWAVWILAAAKLVLHLAVIDRYGYFRDELYNLACSRHLAWGYVDHPPLIAGITWLIRHTLGESLFALRLIPAVIMSLVVVLGGVLARRLGGSRFAQTLTALALCLSPAFVVMGTILTVNVFDILWWTLATWVIVRLIDTGSRGWWLLLGTIFGLGLLTKFTIAFFGIGLICGVLLTRRRNWIVQPWPWAAVGVAIIFLAPCILWQHANGWPTWEFMRHIRSDKNYPVSPFEFAAMQFAVVHPMVFTIAAAGLVWLFRACSAKRFRLFAWTYVVLFVIFAVLQAKFYYLFPIYPILIAAGGVALERWSGRAGRRRWRVVIPVLLLAGTLPTLPLAIPVLSLETFMRYNDTIDYQRHLRFEQGRDRRMPIVYSDMLGWPELARAVAEHYDALVAESGCEVVILTRNYGQAAALDHFGPELGLPPARCAHNAYFTWGPGLTPWDTVIAVGFEEEQLRAHFQSIVALEVVRSARAREGAITLHVCRTPRKDVDEIWQALRRYQ